MSHRSRYRGTTLIDVLLGLVLLCTILSSAIIARGRFMRGVADADRKLRSIAATDQLLSQWLSSDSPNLNLPDSGPANPKAR